MGVGVRWEGALGHWPVLEDRLRLSLFSLDGVSRGHVVAGDVTFPTRVDGASLPPVSFSARAPAATRVIMAAKPNG